MTDPVDKPYLTTDYPTILVDRHEAAVIITFNRMEKYNALNLQMRKDIFDVLDQVRSDVSVRGVILWGGTKAFIAGADVDELKRTRPLDVFSAMSSNPDIWARVAAMPQPVIAAIAGPCMGGGLELALACDVRIAASSALLGQTEVNVGLIPGRGGTQRLTRLIGAMRAKDMVLTGQPIKAQQALDYGLVTRVVDAEALLDEAKAYVAKIAEKPRLSVTMAKLMIDAGQDAPLSSALMMESLAFAGMFTTDDMQEGIDAFLNKRRPEFSGK